MSAPLYGLVLAGGASTRMGRDKAALDYEGTPQLDRAMRLLAPHVAQAFVSVRAGQESDPTRAAWPQIADGPDAVRGPAAGLLAAHRAFPDATWLVLACDLPLLGADTLETLLGAWRKAQEEGEGKAEEAWQAAAFESTHDGLPEPLCTLWSPEALDALAGFVAAGKPCPRKALLNSRTLILDLPTRDALDNVNTPAERDAVLARLAGSR